MAGLYLHSCIMADLVHLVYFLLDWQGSSITIGLYTMVFMKGRIGAAMRREALHYIFGLQRRNEEWDNMIAFLTANRAIQPQPSLVLHFPHTHYSVSTDTPIVHTFGCCHALDFTYYIEVYTTDFVQ